MKRWRFSVVDTELVRLTYADSSTQDIATVIGCTPQQVYGLAKRLGLKKSEVHLQAVQTEATKTLLESGAVHRFKKGSTPANKGRKMPPGWAPGDMARTQFVPGNAPINTLPVGSYRVNNGNRKRGNRPTLEFKFSDASGPYTNRWIPVTRKVWVEANGPVPAGHVVAFKEGRYSVHLPDITLDALECISCAENLQRNRIQNLPPELQQIHRLRGLLTRAVNRRMGSDGPTQLNSDKEPQ